jgi:hypothetical protein
MRAAILVLLLAASTAWAHKPSDAHVRLAVSGDEITGRIDVALRDLDGALVLDADGDGAITWGELQVATPRVVAYLEQRFSIAGCRITFARAALVDLSDGTYWAAPLSAACARTEEITIEYRLLFDIDASHRGLVHVGEQTLIIRDGAPVTAKLGARTSFSSFVVEGIWHIWAGLDHVLFLVCLILPAVFPRRRPPAEPRRVPVGWRQGKGQGRARGEATDDVSLGVAARDVLEIVTAFTLAHSITLVISAVGFVQLPSRFVETAIALSVVAAAVNNLLSAIDARWAVAFALGLLHGFGFSSVLVDLGLPSSELVGSLLGFNLGVEIGQMAIVVALLPVLYIIRRTYAYQAVLWAGSGLTAVIAAIWTVQRMSL